MNHAKLEDFDSVWACFKPYIKTYFPHIRQDYVKRKIQANEVVFEQGVVIIYGIYKRKQKIGDVSSEKGDAHIGQITTINQGAGYSTIVLNNFFEYINSNVWLTVRAENLRARGFYEKNGMLKVSEISWDKGKIPGVVYLKQLKNK